MFTEHVFFLTLRFALLWPQHSGTVWHIFLIRGAVPHVWAPALMNCEGKVRDTLSINCGHFISLIYHTYCLFGFNSWHERFYMYIIKRTQTPAFQLQLTYFVWSQWPLTFHRQNRNSSSSRQSQCLRHDENATTWKYNADGKLLELSKMWVGSLKCGMMIYLYFVPFCIHTKPTLNTHEKEYRT